MLTTQNPKARFGIVIVTGALVTFVSQWEGTSYKVYEDVGGVPTVCQGYTGREVKMGDVWTKEQCDTALRAALKKHGEGVLSCTTYPITQQQYEALTAFAYNVGVSAYCNSTLVKKLNAGDLEGACNELPRWDKVNGKIFRGLLNRRLAEEKLCKG